MDRHGHFKPASDLLRAKIRELGEARGFSATRLLTHWPEIVGDYAVHHVKADGSTSPKVFKGWTLELGPREARTLARQHSFKPITTRRYYPGEHSAELRINGQPLAAAKFHLRA